MNKFGNIVSNVKWGNRDNSTLSSFGIWRKALTVEQEQDYVNVSNQEFPDSTIYPANSKLAIYYKKFIKGQKLGFDAIYDPVIGNYEDQFTNFMLHYTLMTKPEREAFKQLHVHEFPQVGEQTSIIDRLLIEPIFNKHFYKESMRARS